jgi:hypothetical protein
MMMMMMMMMLMMMVVMMMMMMMMLMMISLDSYLHSFLLYRGSRNDSLNYLEELNAQVLEAIVR